MDSCNLDLGNDKDFIPFERRKSISILLGAGFSAPMGYPIGNELNDGLLNFDETIYFAPCGSLACSNDGSKLTFQNEDIFNNHQKYFIFCMRLIQEYSKEHTFDYEEFYDFIKGEDVKQEKYQRLCTDLLTDYENFDHYLFNIGHIYNQMVAHLLKDKNRKSWYDDEPFKQNYFDGYNGFLQYLSSLSEKFIVHVHTLNHDLLFESFNKTGMINGMISDGFDEYRSKYYGKLNYNNSTYYCRLERFTNRYNTPIRLYKLHGSLNYVPFYRQNKDGSMIKEKYVKIKWGIGPDNIMKERKSNAGYDLSPFEYHADFLTGTTSKIQRYNEPLLFRKLFKKFRKNLQNAEKLIIIGYGCKDLGINDMIKENFDYIHKPAFIIDPYAKEDTPVYQLKKDIKAQLIKVDLDKLGKKDFD